MKKSNNDKLTPDVRFRGYTDDWKQRRLGDVATIVSGGTPSTKIKDYWNGTINWYSPAEIDNEVYVNSSQRKITKLGLTKSSASLLPIGTVLFTSRAGIGKTAILNAEACTNQGFQSIVPSKDKLDSYFIYTMTPQLKHYGETHGAGSTFVEVSGKQMAKMPIKLPKYNEQIRISKLFKKLDSFINLLQRKQKQLEQLKKAMLQKMFPKKESQVPEIRFDGFRDVWEQRMFLNSIEKIVDFRGRTPKKLGMNWSNEGYIVLSALNVKDGYIDFAADVHYANQELYDKWMVANDLYKGQVIFTTEAPMGNVAQVPDNRKYVLGQRTIAFDIDETKIINNFLAILLRSQNVQHALKSFASGGTAKGISQRSLSQLKVLVPINIKEQQKVGTFFKLLDFLITLNQKKLDHLTQLKKYLLQKMFI